MASTTRKATVAEEDVDAMEAWTNETCLLIGGERVKKALALKTGLREFCNGTKHDFCKDNQVELTTRTTAPSRREQRLSLPPSSRTSVDIPAKERRAKHKAHKTALQ